jgi:BirA family transcriptional regulator, biotin operon repressor / biotin---[acetyl-CoA-carboxylase] ligase
VTETVSVGGRLWREVRTVGETGSTNADLLAAARAGEPEGLVLVARSQTAGRGRLGRQWQSPPGTALTFSVLLRPAEVPPPALGWLPLLTGVAVTSAVTGVSAVPTRLKWPNDVLAGRAKLGGILAEAWDSAVVIGTGLNVSQRRDQLPATATSLSIAAGTGQPVSRQQLLEAVLASLARWYLAWRDQPSPGDADACGLRAEYLRRCATVGQEVTVMLPDGQSVSGRASGVDRAGQLEVLTAAGPVQVSAGDVVHVRPAAGQAARQPR